MPNKKKNAPKNAFYFYMVELQQEERNRGNSYNMKDIAIIAGPKYKLLPDADKQYYENRAKENKEKLRQTEGKLDSYGNSLDEIARQEKEVMQEEQAMFDAIKFKLQYLGSMEDVANEPFYFLSTKIFCCTDEGEYVPAEIGFAKYSITHGVMSNYHSFIDPGRLPIGYSFECKDMSERTHKIPPQNFELANANYAEIIQKIMDVISPDDAVPENTPPLYVATEEIEHTKAVLEWLQTKAGLRRRIHFKVYDSAVLMFQLLTHVDTTAIISIPLIHDWLAAEHFTYYESTCCPWHFEQDSYEHCALGKVNRTCYVFSDYLCLKFNITPIPNRHLPERPIAESAPYQPTRPRKNRATPIPETPKPMVGQSEVTSIVKNVRSRFNKEEESVFVPSAAPEFRPPMAGSSNSSVASGPSSVAGAAAAAKQPQASNYWSFADIANAQRSVSQQQFQLKDDEFPSLGGLSLDDTRSESALSVSSFGNQSTTSSVPSTTSSWQSSAFSASRNQSPHPIGRGIGRGRPMAKK